MIHSHDLAKHVPLYHELLSCTYSHQCYIFLLRMSSEVSVFRVCTSPLKTAEAISILENISKECCSSLPPVKPKGGEICLS